EARGGSGGGAGAAVGAGIASGVAPEIGPALSDASPGANDDVGVGSGAKRGFGGDGKLAPLSAACAWCTCANGDGPTVVDPSSLSSIASCSGDSPPPGVGGGGIGGAFR